MRLSCSALLGLPSARFRLKGGSPPVIQTESSAQRFHCVLALPALAALRYYDGSDSCGPSPRATGLPAYLATPSQHSAPSHVACLGIALHTTNQRTGRVSDFALEEQARRHTPPNRVRHPADCQFASSCSPPRLAATQLPSATGSWLTLAQTFTVLVSRLHGRTPPPCGLLLYLATTPNRPLQPRSRMPRRPDPTKQVTGRHQAGRGAW